MGVNLVGDAGALPPPPGDGQGAGVPVARHQPPALRHRLSHSAALNPGTGLAGLRGACGRTDRRACGAPAAGPASSAPPGELSDAAGIHGWRVNP